ncbi:MAG: putative gluconeosis factor [Candidatus Kaiserbacteria bacterium]|nr:putative gluconeosis factor [Candidatus Kaiserbacteria bacterium]
MQKVVRIGGGSSGYTLLNALKELPIEITAIVNMFDSGGSSGVLRDELGILPPGDIRRALAALAEGTKGEILRNLFNFRFQDSGSMSGHSFGNVFLAALSSIYGSDIEGIRKASELLDVKGVVLPVSLDRSHIHAVLDDQSTIVGETNIDIPKHDGNKKIQHVYLEPAAEIFSEAADAIRTADIVIIGPGDLYTSIIPNFLVEGMEKAIAESHAKFVVICNLMTKWGETNDYAASDMVRVILEYTGLKKVDYAVCNTAPMNAALVKAYEAEKKYPMVCDDKLKDYAEHVITGGFFSEADIARHDPYKVAEIIAHL